jgi:hypothetical protein
MCRQWTSLRGCNLLPRFLTRYVCRPVCSGSVVLLSCPLQLSLLLFLRQVAVAITAAAAAAAAAAVPASVLIYVGLDQCITSLMVTASSVSVLFTRYCRLRWVAPRRTRWGTSAMASGSCWPHNSSCVEKSSRTTSRSSSLPACPGEARGWVVPCRIGGGGGGGGGGSGDGCGGGGGGGGGGLVVVVVCVRGGALLWSPHTWLTPLLFHAMVVKCV